MLGFDAFQLDSNFFSSGYVGALMGVLEMND
jgi:hypothetical protein